MASKSVRWDTPALTVSTDKSDLADSQRSPTPATAKIRTLKPKSRLTLEEAWRRAELQFKIDTEGKELGALNTLGKDGVLKKWRQAYTPEDAEQSRRSDQMQRVLNNMLNGIELVGAFASQAASTMFPPAGMCFNAIQFLIDAPRQIQKVYDGLKELFDEVEKFLVKFRIYKRIDDKFGLDEDLVINTNNLLISFVRICGLATKLLHGGTWTTFKTAFKVVLFRDDSGVPAELENFRRLATDQSMLTGTVTLEHVLQSEESINQVLSDTGELRSGVNMLLAVSNDEKTRFVNKDRLERINKKLFKKPLSKDEESLPIAPDELLQGTFGELEATADYREWIDVSKSRASTLVIDGLAGSGKSRLLDAIKDHLDTLREEAERDDSSTYVAAFTFADKRPIAANAGATSGPSKKTNQTLIPHALKVVAWQVASQSTTYAKELASDLQKHSPLHTESDIENLWSVLRLSKFKVPRDSVLYILLDGIEREDHKNVKTLLKMVSEQTDDVVDGPRIRLLLTVDSSNLDLADLTTEKPLLHVQAEQINRKLIVPFARNEMQQQNLFQDSDRQTRRMKQQILRTVTTTDNPSFSRVRAKLNRIKDGIDKGLPRDIILKSIGDETGEATSEGHGQTMLSELQSKLSAAETVLLNSVLMWLMAAPWKSMELSILEAALRLNGTDLPIESLAKKITARFSPVLVWSGSMVAMADGVQEYLTESQTSSRSGKSTDSALISLDISIKNATEQVVKRFFWDLNEQMINDKFDFSQVQAAGGHLSYEHLTAQLTVTNLCFKLMNAGWDEDTEPMLPYAYEMFPKHLAELQSIEHLVSKSSRKQIGENLVGFLTDFYPFELRHQNYGDGRWMLDAENIKAIKFWLNDTATTEQLTLKEQRWVKNAIDQNNGVLYFMHDQAVSIGKRWLSDRKVLSYTMWDWIDSYLAAIMSKVGEDEPEIPSEYTTVHAEGSGVPADDVSVGSEEQQVAEGDGVQGQPGDKPVQAGENETQVDLVQTEESNEDRNPENAASANIPNSQEVDGSESGRDAKSSVELAQNNANAKNMGTTTTPEALAEQQDNRTESISIESPSVDQTSSPETAPNPDSASSLDNDGLNNETKSEKDEQEQGVEANNEPDAANADDEDNDEYDRISHVRKWVMQRTSIETGLDYHLTLGDTYYSYGNYDRALRHYRQVVDDQDRRPFALSGIALSQWCSGSQQEAISSFVESFTILQQRAQDDMLDEFDMRTFISSLKEWAANAASTNDNQRALNWYEEALKYKPDDLACCWAALKLRCIVDETQDSAVEFLQKWSVSDENFAGESPALSMLEMTEQAEFSSELLPMVRSIRNERLRTLITTVAVDAVALAGPTIVDYAHSRLHYLRAIACALSSNSDVYEQAKTFWEKTLFTQPAEESNDWEITAMLSKAGTCTTKHKFDTLRLILLSDGQMKGLQEKRAMLQELQEYVRTTVDINSKFERDKGVEDLESFVIAFASLASLHDDARKLCKNDMAHALEILTDSNPDNDLTGLAVLARVFCRLGDKVGLLSAFSLVDRKMLRRRSGETQEDETDMDIDEFSAGRSCDNCGRSIDSMEGLWWCQFCPNFDLCPDCKVEYANGKQRQEMCHPSHVPWYQHLFHSEYSREELEPDKVRIAWRYEEHDDGTFSRTGGHIVDIKDWVEELRKQWDLPEPIGDNSRAQK